MRKRASGGCATSCLAPVADAFCVPSTVSHRLSLATRTLKGRWGMGMGNSDLREEMQEVKKSLSWTLQQVFVKKVAFKPNTESCDHFVRLRWRGRGHFKKSGT